MSQLITSSTPPTFPPCIGQFYRLARNAYVGSDGDVNFVIRFRPLRRKSCVGCPACDFLLGEDLNILIEQFMDGYAEPTGKTGKVYQLKVTNVSTCWETGYVDDYDLEFEEVKT